MKDHLEIHVAILLHTVGVGVAGVRDKAFLSLAALIANAIGAVVDHPINLFAHHEPPFSF